MSIATKQHKAAASARAFLAAVRKAAPFKTFTTFTGNGKEFTNKLFGSCQRWASMSFQLCLVLGMEHRLTKPKVP
ncbi:hypothetical protein P245_12210 [Comamonas thiooxydans]|uniref:Transposase n=1 Tax=Comamonas thiooxydans TaxID=363952 RepID=A0A0E3BEQ2_9BURK|nr:hypothetical protein P245_12210 [Comamonas thiooxydans]